MATSRNRNIMQVNDQSEHLQNSWASNLTEETIAELKECFGLFDNNGDGNISRLELEEKMREMGLLVSDEECKEMMAQIDTDGDECVDFAEFLSFMAVHLEDAKTNDVILMEAFKQFDHDNKGYLTKTDIQKAISILGSETRRDYENILREADLDGDGRISYQEFSNIVVAGQMNY